jgi:hypothetical protein
MSLIPSNRLLFLAPRRRRYEDVETMALDLALDDPTAPAAQGSETAAQDVAQPGPEQLSGDELKARPSSPLLAENLLMFALPPRISDPLIGDLAERLSSIRERYGDLFACAWYWRHAVGSACRFLIAGLLDAIVRQFLSH